MTLRFALIVASLAVLVAPAHAVKLTGSAAGCSDKALGARLAKLDDTKPEYIEIWAKGMQDQSCRGYGPSSGDVTVDERDGDIACIRAPDDGDTCFWVRASIVP